MQQHTTDRLLIGLGWAVIIVGMVAFVAADTPAQPAEPLHFPPTRGSYQVLIERVIDGDTVEIRWLLTDRVRLYGVNAPEMKGPTAERGKESRDYLAELLKPGTTATILVNGREKYGRTLADFRTESQESVSRRMVAGGYAVPWDGTGARPP